MSTFELHLTAHFTANFLQLRVLEMCIRTGYPAKNINSALHFPLSRGRDFSHTYELRRNRSSNEVNFEVLIVWHCTSLHFLVSAVQNLAVCVF
jgi:hypothetical protein